MSDPVVEIINVVLGLIGDTLNRLFVFLGLPDWLYLPIFIAAVTLTFLLALVLDILFIIWMERKVIGRIHHRRSVTETGPVGFFQNIADLIKLLVKEDVYPANADKLMHYAAPILIASIAIIPAALIPYGPEIFFLRMSTSIVLFFAILTLIPGIVLLTGWAGNSKYSTIGAFRAGLQLISYEIPLSLSILGVILMTQSLDFYRVIEAQSNIWFIVLQPLGAFIFFIVSLMELERSPFDIPEAEGEILVGWRTEYSGLKFGLFYAAEYFKFFIASAAFTALFLGGWHGPFFDSAIYFVLKMHIVMLAMIWVRVTFFRPRPDQLIRISYTKLIPLAILNLLWVVLITPFVLPVLY